MSGPQALEPIVGDLIREAIQVDVPAVDTDLIETGLLDSLALVTLITELEREFGFQLPLDDFDVERFRTVERIAAFVAEHRPEAEGSAA
ncbi:acyl carrier protein [Conexibacter arvalis]|uniref:D-alanine--poly(Phosphoribitol) ligase subunit 2 n=1 Tax=Conexibacter arvalis TaxID=912552 RepID=A0A840I9T2_9ACTN|nr:acyl carrier protein [Conexibacter arvalis]MBB4661669.1 D-alanine--poly(phosphoribitol) ligase subunit 2 [Conexibacter arvalis]